MRVPRPSCAACPTSASSTSPRRSTHRRAAEALASFLRDESARPPDASRARVRVLVCPPHCAHEQILAHWAARHGARILDLPDEADVLADTPRWLEACPATHGQSRRPPLGIAPAGALLPAPREGLTLLRSFWPPPSRAASAPG